MMSQMFSNPDMMNSVQEMMKNPELMNNAMKMMSNPDIMKMFGDIGGGGAGLGNMFGGGGMPDMSQMFGEGEDNNEEIEESSDPSFSVDDKVILFGLKKDEYNCKNGVVTEYVTEKDRYSVFVEDMDKTVLLKAENLKLVDNDLEVEELESGDFDIENSIEQGENNESETYPVNENTTCLDSCCDNIYEDLPVVNDLDNLDNLDNLEVNESVNDTNESSTVVETDNTNENSITPDELC